jgi:16S rRNA (cytidine1402-2'-O)-methyltransferase
MDEGTLFVVGTPIGNLEDITLRARRVLEEADLIAAEDTRRARKLLSHLDIHTPLTSYHGHNEREKAASLADEVAAGKKVALLSDAGMPGISDPGFRVVEECAGRGLARAGGPGPSPRPAARALSGRPFSRLRPEGLLPRRRGAS